MVNFLFELQLEFSAIKQLCMYMNMYKIFYSIFHQIAKAK